MNKILEICCGDIESAIAAKRGGAHRVELCAALSEGGVTPSPGLIGSAVALGGIKVNVLIRPRGGDFVYSPAEVECMIRDIEFCKRAGCHGVVVGALRPDGSIDEEVTEVLVAAAGRMSVTFHRAFDLCRDPFEALDALISLGVDRLLTSGQAPTARQGAATLKELVKRAAGRIVIMPGSGVNPDNAAEIFKLTHATEIHASARAPQLSAMTFRRTDVAMGTPGADEYSRLVTSPAVVASIIRNIAD
jgi:copper homeostasis protein